MRIFKADITVWLNVPDDADIEEVGHSFDHGLESALSPFPRAEVIQADLETISPASRSEIMETLGDEFVEGAAS